MAVNLITGREHSSPDPESRLMFVVEVGSNKYAMTHEQVAKLTMLLGGCLRVTQRKWSGPYWLEDPGLAEYGLSLSQRQVRMAPLPPEAPEQAAAE